MKHRVDSIIRRKTRYKICKTRCVSEV